MWPDAPQRAVDIRDRAAILNAQHFERTSIKLLQLADVVETGKEADRSSILADLLLSHRDEFAAGDSEFSELHDFVTEILLDYVEKFRQVFGSRAQQVNPIIAELNRAAAVLGNTTRILLRAEPLTDEEKFYVYGVIHLMDVEGRFDQVSRLLYLLYAETQGQTIDLPGLEDLPVGEIRARMKRLSPSRSQVLFAGWEDGHLRNAVAHMRLEYDAARKLMHFSDRDRVGNPSYDDWLSLEQFTRYVNLTKGVTTVFLQVMLILGVSDVAFAATWRGSRQPEKSPKRGD